jgi:hypothetical protein
MSHDRDFTKDQNEDERVAKRLAAIPEIKALVTKTTTVEFEYFRDGTLWYSVQGYEGPKFIFPVPTDPEEVGRATFNAKDKSIYFMRYIRKYREELVREAAEVGKRGSCSICFTDGCQHIGADGVYHRDRRPE